MGLFSGIKDTYKKSEAAVIVQNLLEHQVNVGFYELNPAKLANQLVEATWCKRPDIYSGKFGQRPYKLTVAASALIDGIKLTSTDSLNRNALILSLGNLIAELETNGSLYPLNSLDHKLLEECVSDFSKIAQGIIELQSDDSVENVSVLDEVSNYLKIMGYDLTEYGAGVSLLEIESGYSAAETALHIAYTTMALDVRESGNNIVKLMSFVPHAKALMDVLRGYKDERLINPTQFQNDINAIIGIVTVNEHQEGWLVQILSDPVAGKERVAISRIDYSEMGSSA